MDVGEHRKKNILPGTRTDRQLPPLQQLIDVQRHETDAPYDARCKSRTGDWTTPESGDSRQQKLAQESAPQEMPRREVGRRPML